MKLIRTTPIAVAVLAAAIAVSPAQNLEEFAKNVTVQRLDNGWTFIVVERPGAPVFSFSTYVNVGSAQEVPGITGLAHMFEHMAFKGTDQIGTKDYDAEKKALKKIEDAYAAYDTERRKQDADPARVADLEKAWKDAQTDAEQYVVNNEFDEIVERAGGVGLNAGTGADSTVYLYSMPGNKLELWAYLESSRFMKPVFREFYKERDVVKEERRMRTESNPIGRMIEQFIATSFTAHPYHQPTVGYMSDLDSFSATDAKEFFRKFYVPSNMVTAVVGDVKAPEVLALVRTYFGRIPASPTPPPLRTVEPPQKVERIIMMKDPSQPIYVEGYHIPAKTDPDSAAYQALATILGEGRTSRLYRRLVRDEGIAAAAQALTGFPGDKYPNMFLAFAVATPGHTNDEIVSAMREEIDRMTTEEVTPAELASVKARAKMDLLRSLDSNQGLAVSLAEYQTLYGDWRELFRSVDRIDKLTAEDILRVAKATFRENNRTVGMIETATGAGAGQTGMNGADDASSAR